MTSRPAGFHPGELAVQDRAGVRAEAARLAGMLAPAHLSGGAAQFLGQRTFAVLTARDRAGRLWVSPLTGRPGFLDGDQQRLHIHAGPSAGDPLHGLATGQPVGLVTVEFATRRRLRVNGTLAVAGPEALEIAVDQAYGNCPQYIHQRTLQPAADGPVQASVAPATVSSTLDATQTALIERGDTFFLGTTHPGRGSDASHRGGPAGFVRVEQNIVSWPDYPGNNMFNSLGNLAVDDAAALLFIDFVTGRTVHLSGTAALDWQTPDPNGDDGGTGRRVRFSPQHIVDGPPLPLRAA